MFAFRRNESIELDKYEDNNEGFLVKLFDTNPPKELPLAETTYPDNKPATPYGLCVAEVHDGFLSWISLDTYAKSYVADVMINAVDKGWCELDEWVWMVVKE